VRKASRLVLSSRAVSEALALRCPGNHSHRQIQGTWRSNGKRVDAAAWCGGYTNEFATHVLEGFEKQLNNDMGAHSRRAEMEQVPLNGLKARRQALLDDVPSSIRNEFVATSGGTLG
jgi:hypothetical protein